MSTRVIQGPWGLDQPLRWYASVNGGASAFSVTGNTQQAACGAAASRIYGELRREIYGAASEAADDGADPFELDTAAEAELERRFAAECARLTVYTPQEWNEQCLRSYHAQRGGAA